MKAKIVFRHGYWHVKSSPVLTGFENHSAAVRFCLRLNVKLNEGAAIYAR